MKSIKRILSLVIIAILIGTYIPAKLQEKKETYTKLIVALPLMNISEKEIHSIQDKINKITEKKIGVTVEFPVLSSYYDDVTTMLSTNEQVDIMLGGYGSFMECYVEGYLYPLDELLQKYGIDIIKEVGEDKINCCKINNNLYGIPINGRYTITGSIFFLNKDILKKENINIKQIHTMDDLEKTFHQIKENYKDVKVLTKNPMNTLMSNEYFLNTANGIPLMALMNDGKDTKLQEIFSSTEYQEGLKRVRRWYLKGYYDENIFEKTEDVYSQIKQEKIFACLGENESLMQNLGMEKLILDEQKELNYYGYSTRPFVILKNSISPEKAMQLLNLFYSDKKIKDYLCYVLEGKSIRYWDETQKKNEQAVQSNMIGFNFDYSKVDSEYREVVDIYNDYKWILENGLVNPEKGIKQMRDEMQESGLDLIINEEERQYNDWLRNKNEGK